jgi:nitrogenase molybdenum-iron protein alpha/beta subunit
MLLAGLDPPLGHPVIHVPSGSLAGDWLDGYAAVLTALAREVPLAVAGPGPGPAARPQRVALVGHLHHRLEADVTADLAELRRLVTALGLEVVCAWPDGGAWADLAAAGSADLVLSLPYARRAARVLAERTGAALLELELPIGLEASCRFVRQVGAATGRNHQAEAFVAQELDRVVPRLEWILAHELLGRQILVASDPHLVRGLRGALTELGCTVGRELVYARSEHGATPPDPADADAPPHHVAPRMAALTVENHGHRVSRGIDLVVGCSFAVELLSEDAQRIPLVEVGFPQYYTHALHPQPLLGFDGALCFVSRLVTALRHQDVTRV